MTIVRQVDRSFLPHVSHPCQIANKTLAELAADVIMASFLPLSFLIRV